MGAWPDRVQGIVQPLCLPGCEVKQALVQVSFLASHQVVCAHVLWIKLEHLEPTEAKPEGEGTVVWEDDLGKGRPEARVHLKAVATFLSLEGTGKPGICLNLSLHLLQGRPQSSSTLQSPRKGLLQREAPSPARGPGPA